MLRETFGVQSWPQLNCYFKKKGLILLHDIYFKTFSRKSLDVTNDKWSQTIKLSYNSRWKVSLKQQMAHWYNHCNNLYSYPINSINLPLNVNILFSCRVYGNMSVSRKSTSTSLHANIKLNDFILVLAPIVRVFILISLMLLNDHIHSFIKSSGLLKTDAHVSPWIVHGRGQNSLMFFYFLSFHEFPLI